MASYSQPRHDLTKANNVPFSLRSSQDAAVQETRINPALLQEVAGKVRARLLEFAVQLGMG